MLNLLVSEVAKTKERDIKALQGRCRTIIIILKLL